MKVFVSSITKLNAERRTNIVERLCGIGVQAVTAETIGHNIGFIKLPPDRRNRIEASDICLENIASCDLVMCVINENLGSHILKEDVILEAKHFEIEILSASLQRKPMVIWNASTSVRDHETQDFINCILTDDNLCSTSSLDAAIAAIELYQQTGNHGFGNKQKSNNPKMYGLTNRLAIIRASYGSLFSQRMELPFLGSAIFTGSRPNVDLALDLAADATRQQNLHIRIARLWGSIRELSPSHPLDSSDPIILHAWDKVLGAWASAASWYGLHAHIHVGCVAACTTHWRLRQIMRAGLPGNKDIEIPVGALASANYSLIKRLPLLIRIGAFRKLIKFMDENISQAQYTSGLLAIRGSINIQLLNPFAAYRDFELGLRKLEEQGGSPLRVADAKIHLAVASGMLFRRSEARALIDDGLREMRGKVSAGEMLRALRKGIFVEKIPFGSRRRKIELIEEFNHLKRDNSGYLDQMGAID